ncbi:MULTISPECIES: response regulator transcription factor [unclassified Micromonospora]|uniref:response regulator transcription factor n=1 Tax=unclassified Micromonospora TaxID=2617518 RepID=UPI0027E4C212|nr:response regulator transcription factor [Micromonospora sp. AKA38]
MPPDDEEAPPQSRISVAIVDQHPMVIEGARSWLAAEPRLALRSTGADLETLLADEQSPVDVILLDLRSGGRLVIDKIAELSRAGRRVVVYSEDTSPDTAMSLLEAGAITFLGKHESREHFVQALLAAASDQPYVPPVLAGAIAADQSADRPVLSPKEREALLLWFQSMSKASVARRMRISEHTVKQYIDRARIKYARTGRPAATKAALLARAIEDGLVHSDEIGPHARHSEPIEQSGYGETA